MKRKQIVFAIVTGVLALATGGWLLQRGATPSGSVYQQARLFDDVLARVADFYVDSIDERQLYQMAIDGLLDQLHDPYSVYLKPDDFHALSEQTTGEYGGLGIQIDVRDGWITVVAPLPDTPAERAGVLTGDRIVMLDGRSTEGWKNDQAVRELRGTAGSSVELKIRRVGVEQPITFKMTRAVIHVRSVQVAMLLDDNVGYISLNPVNQTSGQELATAVDSLEKRGMKSLVLDLRFNPGGLLDQAVSGSDLFLDPGQEGREQRGRAPGPSRKDSTAVPDSLVFHTDRGRLVRGGGGIRPDVFVAPDTYTTAERGFLRTLGSKISVYRDVISSYALELKAGGHLTTPSFPVTPAMVDEVARRLQARGVSVPDSVVAGARSLISLELGVEAARYVFGRPAEFRRRMGEDPQVQNALALARRAKSPADLLARVAAAAPALRN